MSSTSIVKNGEAKSQQVELRGVDAIYESLALRGDISGLKPADKIKYYRALCERLGLDPMTQPFLPLRLNNKEILYASRAATDQLARIHSVTREVIKREVISDVYVVTCRASLPSGRVEESIGAVSIKGLQGDALANGLMKAESKSKRRATLSILALGMLDELEIETIPKNQVEHLQSYEIDGSAAEAVAEDTGASTDDVPRQGVDVPVLSDEDHEAEERHASLQQRLLQEIRQLRDVGVAFSRTQGEMVRLTGKYQRCDLTSEEIEKLIAHFADWAKSEAEKLRDQK
jgi:hypothetical protein